MNGCLKIIKFELLTLWMIPFQSFIYGHVAMLSIGIEIWYLRYFLYNILHKI